MSTGGVSSCLVAVASWHRGGYRRDIECACATLNTCGYRAVGWTAVRGLRAKATLYTRPTGRRRCASSMSRSSVLLYSQFAAKAEVQGHDADIRFVTSPGMVERRRYNPRAKSTDQGASSAETYRVHILWLACLLPSRRTDVQYRYGGAGEDAVEHLDKMDVLASHKRRFAPTQAARIHGGFVAGQL